MRKVFQSEAGSGAGMALSILCSVGLTALLFGILPFAHRVATPQSTLELRKIGSAEMPPVPEEELPPQDAESEPPPSAAPEPQLAETQQQVPLSADLEIAMGAGGALAGFGESQSFAAAQAAESDTFQVTDLEKRPEVVAQVPPAYPSDLRKAKIEGSVTIVFLLDEQGRVEDPRVDQSSRPEFERPALEAVRKWRFKPGELDGKPVKTYMRLPMRFRISG